MLASTSQLVLDYIEALAWPVLIALLAAVMFWRYHNNVGNLIDRIKSVKALGAEVGFANPAEQENAQGDEEAAEETLDDHGELVNALQEGFEARFQEQQLEAQEERRRLLRQLAVKNLQVAYERIYRVIYGSQIAALRSLRVAEEGLQRSALEAHLDQIKATFTAMPFIQGLTFDTWVGYLLRTGLLMNPQGDTFKITTKGSGFLDYIDAGRYPPRMF